MGTTLSREDYLKTAHLLGIFTAKQMVVWFTSGLGRHRRTETMLPRLVRKGKLKVTQFGPYYVYFTPQKARRKDVTYPLNIIHGLGISEGLVRFWRSDMNGEIIPAPHFRGLGAVPEWGIRYSSALLLYEFCTFDNHYTTLKDKVERYSKVMGDIQTKFNAKPFVIFVSDVERKYVESFIERHHPIGDFLFTDYDTFKSVPIGEQLTSKIYLWGENGQPLSLRS